MTPSFDRTNLPININRNCWFAASMALGQIWVLFWWAAHDPCLDMCHTILFAGNMASSMLVGSCLADLGCNSKPGGLFCLWAKLHLEMGRHWATNHRILEAKRHGLSTAPDFFPRTTPAKPPDVVPDRSHVFGGPVPSRPKKRRSVVRNHLCPATVREHRHQRARAEN